MQARTGQKLTKLAAKYAAFSGGKVKTLNAYSTLRTLEPYEHLALFRFLFSELSTASNHVNK